MEEGEPPVYAVRFAPVATRAIDATTIFVYDNCGKVGADAEEYARAFRKGLNAAVGTLATLPMRFPIAEEATIMEPPLVRVMPYRQRPGSPAWRVLYRVYEADENDMGRIEIVALRHGSQKPMTREEGRDIDAANR